MLKRLKKVAGKAANLKTKILFQIVFQNSEVQDLIVDLNRIEQLFKEGIDSTGKIIGEYSEVTEMLTQGQSFGYGGSSGKKQKKAGQPIFLLDEGDFYKSFKVKLLNDGFVIQADALKDDGTDLTEQFGKNILGLTNESKAKIITQILPELIQETRKAIIG